MNKAYIIGNLTRDPELRTAHTSDGDVYVCNFTIAVNRRQRSQDGQQEADFFRVTTWRGLAENCSKYLAKGRKAAVTGPVSVSTYIGNDGVTRANLEITADDVEFLTPKGEGNTPAAQGAQTSPATYPQVQQPQFDPQSGFVQVDDDELPF